MTALAERTGAGRQAGEHLLALPASASVVELAHAWFPDATWLVAPVAGLGAQPAPRGARLRGMPAGPAAEPGLLRLSPGLSLAGPHPVTTDDARRLALPPREAVAYLLVRDDVPPGRAPSSHDGSDHVLRWMVAAARHARGAVLPAGASQAVVPDVDRSVNLRLFSAHALPAATALALVRTVLVQARLDSTPAPADGPQDYEIRATTPYDGTVSVRVSRSGELPPALLSIPWRESGPFRYAVRWLSGDVEQELSESPSAAHLVARSRVAPTVRRVTAVLHRAIAGTVLDDGGFLRRLDG